MREFGLREGPSRLSAIGCYRELTTEVNRRFNYNPPLCLVNLNQKEFTISKNYPTADIQQIIRKRCCSECPLSGYCGHNERVRNWARSRNGVGLQ